MYASITPASQPVSIAKRGPRPLRGIGSAVAHAAAPASGSHGLSPRRSDHWRRRPLSGLTFDGTGLFGTGMFGSSSWDWSEWTVIGLGAFAAYSLFFGGKKSFGFSSGRRKKLAVARAKYELERAEA